MSDLDRLIAQQLNTEVALTDADVTKSIADGQRYRILGNVLTRARFVTLSNADAVAGDKVYFRVEPGTATLAFNSLIVKNAGGAVILNIPCSEARVYVAEYDSTAWRGGAPAGLQVFNVKDYGAVGDEVHGVLNQAAEAAAIQACINAAAACARATYHSGAVVYFPPGVYRTDGVPLILRRTLYNSPLTYMGAGFRTSTIVNAIGVGPLGDVFRGETRDENENPLHGGEGHTFQDLNIIARHYAFIWDYGDGVEPGTDDGMRLGPQFTRCHFARPGSPGPAVRIRIASRAKFVECTFDPSNVVPGVIGLEIVRGSGSMYACKGGGSLVRMRDAAEVSLIGCRCEGSQAVPAWDFYNVLNLTIQNATNEGNDEYDACFRFTECRQITCDNLSPAVTRSYVVLTALSPIIADPITGAPTITFTHVDALGTPEGSGYRVAENKIVRSSGSWFEDKIGYGGKIKIDGAIEGNGGWLTILEATHDTLWVKETLLEDAVVAATGAATYAIGLFNPAALPGIWFDEATQTITRADGDWGVDGFEAGMVITTSSTTNPGPFTIATGGVAGDTLTLVAGIADEGTALVPVHKRVTANKTAAGTTLRSCWNFHIRNQQQNQGGFSTIGGGTRYGIEVDGDCRDGTVENAHIGSQSDIFIHPDAVNVIGQSHGNSINPSYRRTWWHGKQTYAELDVLSPLTHVNTDALTTPSASILLGHSIRRGPIASFDAVGCYYKESADAGFLNGFYAGYTANELAISANGLVDFHAKRFVGPTNDTATIVARSGGSFAVAFSSSSDPLHVGNTFKLSIVGNDLVLNGCTRIFRTGALNFETTSAITIAPNTTTDIYGGGALCFSAAASGGTVQNIRPLQSPATGTGISTVRNGHVTRVTHVRTFTYQAFQVAATSKIIVVCSLPAKTRVVSVVCDTSTQFTGLLTCTLKVGTESVAIDSLILSHDVLASPVVKGLADGDLGAGLARATAVHGGHIASWTAAKELRIQMDGGTDLSNLTGGVVSVYVTLESLGPA